MTEFKDSKTKICRHEYSTVTPAESRKYIEEAGAKLVSRNGDIYKYSIRERDNIMEVQATPTRVIIFGFNRASMLRVAKLMHFEIWEYDNTTERTDYMVGR